MSSCLHCCFSNDKSVQRAWKKSKFKSMFHTKMGRRKGQEEIRWWRRRTISINRRHDTCVLFFCSFPLPCPVFPNSLQETKSMIILKHDVMMRMTMQLAEMLNLLQVILHMNSSIRVFYYSIRKDETTATLTTTTFVYLPFVSLLCFVVIRVFQVCESMDEQRSR